MLASFLAFSTKLTTPFPIAFFGLCTPLKSDRQERGKKLLGILLGMAATLFLIVGATSYLNCSWTEPFAYILSALAQKTDGDITRVLLSFLRVTLWFSPFSMVLAAWAIYLSFKKDDFRLRATSLTLLTVFLAYLIVGGAVHGYPKYHIPLLPLLFFLLGRHFLNSQDLPPLKLHFWVALIVLCSSIFGFVMPDPLLLVNFQLRESLAAGEPLKRIYCEAGAIGGLLFLTPLIIALLLNINPRKNRYRTFWLLHFLSA